MITNRTSIKSTIKSILDTALVGKKKPLQLVYDYLSSDLGGKSPVVCMRSGGSLHSKPYAGSARESLDVRIELWLFVRDADTSIKWTEKQAEDSLDTAEADIADALFQAVIARTIPTLEWENISDIEPVVVNSVAYLLEKISLIVKVR